MEKIKTLIVDDEDLARQKIRRLLSARQETFEIQEASNGMEALKLIAQLDPDLIFLDVEMPEITGIDVLSQLEKRTAKIIFQTAHDDFALRAFEANACDYILKPYSDERFQQAVDRALSEATLQAKLSQMEMNLQKEGAWLRNMIAKQGDKYVVVQDKDILCFISKEHYTTLRTTAGEFVCDLSLNHLEKHLDPKQFTRLHRNSIVRISAIKTFGSKLGESQVVLVDGTALAVSRQHQKSLKNLFLKL